MSHNTYMDSILVSIFQLTVLLFSIIIHEVSHGFMALKLGDDTAKNAGRLTLNPLKHLDPVGSVIVPLLLYISRSSILIGWAKPVPYNPNLLHKDYKHGPLKVALAGPASNLIVAAIFGLIIRLTFSFLDPFAIMLLSYIVFLNSLLAIFNLLPIPPLDGSAIITAILPRRYSLVVQNLGFNGIIIVFLFLALFSGFIFGAASSISGLLIGKEILGV